MVEERAKQEDMQNLNKINNSFVIHSNFNLEQQLNTLVKVLEEKEILITTLAYHGVLFKQTNLRRLIPLIQDSSITRLKFKCNNKEEDVDEEAVELEFLQPLQFICSIHPIIELEVYSGNLGKQITRAISTILTSEGNSIKKLYITVPYENIDFILESFIHSTCKLEEISLFSSSHLTFQQVEKLFQVRNLRKLDCPWNRYDVHKVLSLFKRSCLEDINVGVLNKKMEYVNYLAKTRMFKLWVLLLSVQLGNRKETKGLGMLPNELIRLLIMTFEPPYHAPYLIDVASFL